MIESTNIVNFINDRLCGNGGVVRLAGVRTSPTYVRDPEDQAIRLDSSLTVHYNNRTLMQFRSV